ncbi:MAG: hypothetical protein IJP31_04330 [Lachnospiraceae bacterium]|nr:hypothetical protein [Lachnospiraceae bacterium]
MDLNYTWIQWLFFFFFYCFFGWCFESSYVSLKEGHPINRGFMRGPFLPLYGTGALMMLIVSAPVRDNLLLTYIAGCIGATVLEYFTGAAMEALFKVRYWDYSDQPFNYKGHICLSSSLAWGGLTIFMTRLIHQPIESVVLAIPEGILTLSTMLLVLAIVVDFTLSFKAALDLRDVLIAMEEARREAERLQKRVDVLIAISEQEKEERRQEREARAGAFASQMEAKVEELSDYVEIRMEELNRRMEEKLGRFKERLSLGELSEDVREELQELKEKFHFQKENRFRLSHKQNRLMASILKGNPSLRSERFKDALEELKEALEEYKKKK